MQLLKRVSKKSLAKACLLMSTLGVSVAQANTADILVFYTPDAASTTEGRDMPARVSSYISFANQSLRNSQVDLQFNLVGLERLNSGYDYPNYNNVSNLTRDRYVANKRAEYGADMVTVLNLRQPTGGGFICGIAAAVTRGDSRTGRFNNYAASVAFNLTGINCGLNTFIHEFGHNMGLGHGVKQNAPGGVFAWGRGYGVDGSFSTIMGYPQAYGTRNQLPIFSNAERFVCEGLACGRDASLRNGADASRALNIVASQVANFSPRRGTPSPGCGNNCNLISNGGFEQSMAGWSSKYGEADLASVNVTVRGQAANVARVTSRQDYRAGLYQDLGTRLKPGVSYTLSGGFATTGNTDGDEFKFALEIREGGSTRFQYLPTLQVPNAKLTDYSTTFQVNAQNPSGVGIVIYGPDQSLTLYADNIAVKAN